MTRAELEHELRQTLHTAASITTPPADLAGTLVSAARSAQRTPVRGMASSGRRWLLPLAAASAVLLLTGGIVEAVNGASRSRLPAPQAASTDAVNPIVSASTSSSAAVAVTSGSSTPSAHRSRTPSKAATASTSTAPSRSSATPQPVLVGPGEYCNVYQNVDGRYQQVMVRSGHDSCAAMGQVVEAFLAEAKATNAPAADFIGPLSVEGWVCQSGPAANRYTVCEKGGKALSLGQFAPTPWQAFSSSLGDAPQFYLDGSQTIRFYTTHAGFGSSSCSYAPSASGNAPNSPTAAALGIAVTVADVQTTGTIVSGDVIVKNVSNASVTLHETFDQVGDQLLSGHEIVTPSGGWDGPMLGEHTITLAPGSAFSAQRQLPAYDCNGNALVAGRYTAQFYLALAVYSGGASTTVFVPAENTPTATIG